MDVVELGARESIRELCARYAHAADRGHFGELADLFADDGILEIAGSEAYTGRPAIVAALTGVGVDLRAGTTVPMIRHHVSSLTISVDGPDEARSWSYFLAVTERGPDHWGRYSDRLVRERGHWRFAHRRVRTDGAAPGAWAEGR
ncbi:MAG: nuclear transport factor 2 family protein [Actinomycetes bacterium]